MRRSMLFLPGNNPNMLVNAQYLGADSVIFDLEDAVSPDEKDAARILVSNTLSYMKNRQTEIVIRINSVDTPYWRKDIDAVLFAEPDMILLPKTQRKEDVLTLWKYISEVSKKEEKSTNVGVIALIETALGVENAYEIATSSECVKALFLGAEDLTADLGCKRTKGGREIEYSRSRLVVAAKAAGIDVYDTPFTDVNDDEGAVADVMTAKELGFTGKASISPRHIEIINSIFSPTLEEIEYAYEVVEAITRAKEQGLGVVSLYGKMIDAPIVQRARKTIDMAKELGIDGGKLYE